MLLRGQGISGGVSPSSNSAADRSVVPSETRAGEAITWESAARDRLAKIDLMQMRLRAALTDWADDDLLIARLQELEREAEPLRETLGMSRLASSGVAFGS